MVTNNILALSIKSDIIQQWLADIDFKFYKGGKHVTISQHYVPCVKLSAQCDKSRWVTEEVICIP